MTPLALANMHTQASAISSFGPYRYATADRFQAPQLVQGLQEVPKTVCPQTPSRLATIMGDPQDDPAPAMDEDCLHLKVYAPPKHRSRGGRHALPVMVFIHGGAFVGGGGVYDWYDGTRLAEHGVVVVSINYRLGALGFLSLPGGDTLNGHRDQVTALQWVQKNIAKFGGDPKRVTIFGQSAGALSVAEMYRSREAKELYHAGVMESGPFELTDRTVNETIEIGANFTRILGEDPYTANVSAILSAQGEVTVQTIAKHGGDTLKVAFFPLPQGPVLPHGPLIAGWNEDDQRAFGAAAETAVDATLHEYVNSTADFESQIKATGYNTATYVFTLHPGAFGAVHIAEVPYILGTEHAWAHAPMLNHTTWHEVDKRGWPMRKAWATFARTTNVDKAKEVDVPYLDWLN